jgi:uncharacterized membrane protein
MTMNLLQDTAPLALVILGWLVVIPCAAWSLIAVRRQFLPSPLAQHAWLGAVVATAFLWQLHVRSPVGLDFGLLAALALHTVMGDGSWLNFGISGTLLAVVPAFAASALQRLIERWLPRNIFVFIIGNGLFVTMAVTALASALLLAAAATGTHAVLRQLDEHIAYALLLAWGEALASGMVFSALVVFLPQAVLTYRQDTYLPPRRPSV